MLCSCSPAIFCSDEMMLMLLRCGGDVLSKKVERRMGGAKRELEEKSWGHVAARLHGVSVNSTLTDNNKC